MVRHARTRCSSKLDFESNPTNESIPEPEPSVSAIEAPISTVRVTSLSISDAIDLEINKNSFKIASKCNIKTICDILKLNFSVYKKKISNKITQFRILSNKPESQPQPLKVPDKAHPIKAQDKPHPVNLIPQMIGMQYVSSDSGTGDETSFLASAKRKRKRLAKIKKRDPSQARIKTAKMYKLNETMHAIYVHKFRKINLKRSQLLHELSLYHYHDAKHVWDLLYLMSQRPESTIVISSQRMNEPFIMFRSWKHASFSKELKNKEHLTYHL